MPSFPFCMASLTLLPDRLSCFLHARIGVHTQMVNREKRSDPDGEDRP